MIGEAGEPRVKLYHDDGGRFKGEALVMYFKEGSVDLAITLLDDTELELGAGYGSMRVREAEYEKSKDAEKKEEPVEKKKLSAEEKQRLSKRIKTMQQWVSTPTGLRRSKVTWFEDDDDDDPAAPSEGAPRPGNNRFDRVVVLKGMFTLEDITRDPALLLDLKEDVREEAEGLGQVTSVVLFDVSRSC